VERAILVVNLVPTLLQIQVVFDNRFLEAIEEARQPAEIRRIENC
jgi:hypothetical protein